MAFANGLNFNELSNDLRFVSTSQNFDELISKIEKQIEMAVKLRKNPKLTLADSKKVDNYLEFAINTFYWICVKIKGYRNNLPYMNAELSRIRGTVRDKEIEPVAVAPRLNMPVVRRLIARGLDMRVDDVTNKLVPKKVIIKDD